jgi:hypothetical protein
VTGCRRQQVNKGEKGGLEKVLGLEFDGVQDGRKGTIRSSKN